MTHVELTTRPVPWLPYARPIVPGDRVRVGGRKLWLIAVVKTVGLGARSSVAIVAEKRNDQRGGRPVALSKLKRAGKHS